MTIKELKLLLTLKYLNVKDKESDRRMTNCQLQEWLAKGNGVMSTMSYSDSDEITTHLNCTISDLRSEVPNTIMIRRFGESNWTEPTLSIYKHDCKR